jgi:hypothetical protein
VATLRKLRKLRKPSEGAVSAVSAARYSPEFQSPRNKFQLHDTPLRQVHIFATIDHSVAEKYRGEAGIVYILTNIAMLGLLKLGITSAGSIEDRMRTLDNTSVPMPFECFYAAEVADPSRVERAIHEAFDDHRVRPSREFFRLSPDKPKAIIELLE